MKRKRTYSAKFIIFGRLILVVLMLFTVVAYTAKPEELATHVASGGDVNPYDVIHPSDNMIGVLIREWILAKLDQSKMPNNKNLDTGLVSASGDTVNYLVPYQMGFKG